jgi:tRNA U34 5-methylaminomethyl-2-thiouridine-forming methyltransferase MnmC
MNSEDIKLIITEDGSHSLFNPKLNETYHSFHGALQESRHVFIKEGLEHFSQNNNASEINVFEVGLGTGLNALLSIEWALNKKIKVNYHSIEAFPISRQQAATLNYSKLMGMTDSEQYFKQIHELAWDQDFDINEFFAFRKIHNTLQDYDLKENEYDLIFFDAFAPNKQSEMWDLTILSKIASSMKVNGEFVTYCAQGQLKRNLKSLVLIVETIAGPPGKKEMVRAVKTENSGTE